MTEQYQMERADMNRILEPYAKRFDDLLRISDLTPEEIADLETAVNMVTTTNCWFRSYEIAQHLKRQIAEYKRYLVGAQGEE